MPSDKRRPTIGSTAVFCTSRLIFRRPLTTRPRICCSTCWTGSGTHPQRSIPGGPMPSFIVKPVAGEDFYVVWSTVVDAPTAFGSRQELEPLLRGDEGAPERFDRADQYGTSMRGRQRFGWHDQEFMLREWPIPNARYDEGIYQVPRKNVRALCER